MRRHRTYVALLTALLVSCSPAAVRGQSEEKTIEQPTASKGDQSRQEKPPTARQQREAEKVYLAGAKALEQNDFDTAEKNFDTAVDLVPHNERYLASRQITHEHHATALIEAAEKAKLLGHTDEARNDFIKAFAIDPNNPMVVQHMDEIAQDTVSDREATTTESVNAGPPIELTPGPGRRSFHLRANSTDILRQVLTAYGITPVFDSSVKGKVVRLDADDVNFDQAARMSKLITNTFFVPLDPARVLVAGDTKENRTKFERLAVETVYFPGLTPAEINDMGNMARNLFDAQQTTVSPANSTLTVRAPTAKLSALNSTLAEMLDGRSEVQLDVRLYSIAKTRTANIGMQLPQQATIFNVPTELNSVISNNQSLVQQIVSSGLASAGDYAAIAAILIASGAVSGSILGQPFAVFGGGLTLTGLAVNGVTGNLALNSSDTRALDSITLRLLDQEESTIRSGTRYPIITSSYSSLAGNSLAIPGLSSAGVSSALAGLGVTTSQLASSNQVIPQVQYEDLGLTLKVTPHVQQAHDVSLKLDLKIDSLQGTMLNNIPVLDSQQYTAVTTLKPGEAALVVSSLSKQQSKAVTGVPGLSDLPGFQSTTNNQTETDASELLILITPHIVREAHRQMAGRMFLLPVHQ
jgi:general secretion pathway protein D